MVWRRLPRFGGNGYAVVNGASEIIITGIGPTSHGHVYNTLGLPRLHASAYWDILQELHTRGFPLSTSDPHVAMSLGLPLRD